MNQHDAIKELQSTQQESRLITVDAYTERLHRIEPDVTAEQAQAMIDQFVTDGVLQRCAPFPDSPEAGSDAVLWELTEKGFDA